MNEPKADGKRSIYCPVEKTDFDKIFNQLMYGLDFAGGDGDVALFLRWHNYEEVAELFKNYEVEYIDKSKHKMTELYQVRMDVKKIVFERMNESITIGEYNKDTFDAEPYTELVIIH